MRIIRNKRGVTLVELLLSIAIFGIVMVSLFSFMTVISKQYSKANDEVAVQNEVQTLMSHLQNLITSADSNIGIDGNRLFMISDEDFEVIEYDASRKYLYYYSVNQLNEPDTELAAYKGLEDRDDKLAKAISIVTNYPVTSIEANLSTYLLTEYVSEFTISPNVTDNFVAINVTLTRDNVTYSAAKNIYLRNKLYEITTSGVSSSPVKSTTAASSATTAASGGGGGTPATPATTAASATPSGDAATEAVPETTPGILATSASSEEVPPSTEAVTVNGISLSCNKGEVYFGETLSKSDFTVTLHYSDGSTAVTDDWTTSSSFTVSENNNWFSVSAAGQSTGINLSVVELSGIKVQYIGGEKKVGDTLTASELKVTNLYSNGHQTETTDYTCDILGSSLPAGNCQIQVKSTVKDTCSATAYLIVKTSESEDVETYDGYGGSLPAAEEGKYKYVLDVSSSNLTRYLFIECYNGTATVKHATTGATLATVRGGNAHIDLASYAGTDTRFIIEVSDYVYTIAPVIRLWNSVWEHDYSAAPGSVQVSTDKKNTVDQVTIN